MPDNVDVFGAFGDFCVVKVTLESAWLRPLLCINIQFQPGAGFYPGNNPRNIIELHVSTGPECVKYLLGPGSAAFTKGCNDDIGATGLVRGNTGFNQVGCGRTLKYFTEFLERFRAFSNWLIHSYSITGLKKINAVYQMHGFCKCREVWCLDGDRVPGVSARRG